MNPEVEVSDAYVVPERPGDIVMNVSFSTFAKTIKDSKLMYEAIYDGVSKFIEKKMEEKHFKTMIFGDDKMSKHFEEVLMEALEKRALEIVAKMDMQAIANMAAIGCAKKLGEKVGQ